MSDATSDAYVAALKMLARRELSEAQIRQRLARRGHEPDAIDAAVERLRRDRSLDDERTASAIARTAVTVRRRGPLRVAREIEAAGISKATARRVIDEVYDDIDTESLLSTVLTKRLRGRETIESDAEFARLYRYLMGQGFESDAVLKALRARSLK